MPIGARLAGGAFAASAILALAAALAGCVGVETSLALGNVREAEMAASRAQGDERRLAYLQLAEEAVQREDYAAAIRAYSSIEDYQSLFELGQRLEGTVRDGTVPAAKRDAAITAALLSFRRAALFANRYVVKYKGLWLTTEQGIAPHGMSFAVWLGLEDSKYFGAIDSIAAAAAIPPREYGESVGKQIWEFYIKDPDLYRGSLPVARKYFMMSDRKDAWLRTLEYTIGDELARQGKYDEALAAYRNLGDDEKAAAARVGYCILSPRDRASLDVEGIRLALSWFERGADSEGRRKALLALCDAYLRLGNIAEAEGALRDAGWRDQGRAEALADAWLEAGEHERAAALYAANDLRYEAERVYMDIAATRFAAGDYDSALEALNSSGWPDRRIGRYLEVIARWYEGRGEDAKAAPLYARARSFDKAREAYGRLVAAAAASGDYEGAIGIGGAMSLASEGAEPSGRPPAFMPGAGRRLPAREAPATGLGSRRCALDACVEALAARETWRELTGLVAYAGAEGARAGAAIAAWLERSGKREAAQRVLEAVGAAAFQRDRPSW